MTFTPRKIPHTGVSARSILILSHQAVMVNGKKQFFAERSADVEASINIADLPAGCCACGDWGQTFECRGHYGGVLTFKQFQGTN